MLMRKGLDTLVHEAIVKNIGNSIAPKHRREVVEATRRPISNKTYYAGFIDDMSTAGEVDRADRRAHAIKITWSCGVRMVINWDKSNAINTVGLMVGGRAMKGRDEF